MNRHRRETVEIDLGGLAGPVSLFVLVLIALTVAMNGYYTVEPNEEVVLLRFGKYVATTTPGLHFKIPFVDKVVKVDIKENIFRLPSGGPAERPRDVREEESLMLTGDLNAAAVEWTVQWKVQEPLDRLLSFYDRNDPAFIENVIRMVAQTEMNRLIGDYSIGEVLTEKREEIASAAEDAMQERLDKYKCGIEITKLTLQRVMPPNKVRPAFDAVNSAVQKRDQLENEANIERNKLLPAAKAERDKKIREAEGYADRRRAEVNGEVTALLEKYKAYQQAPDVTRQRLYLEAMEEVLQGIDEKIIIDAELNQVLPLLPLQKGGN